MGIAESNGDVRVLIGSWEITVYAHAQYIFGPNSPSQVARRLAALSCNAFSIATFASFFQRFPTQLCQYVGGGSLIM